MKGDFITNNKIIFDSFIFDTENKTITILNGSEGTYSYKNIVKCNILNEKAKYHGKDIPFLATIPNGPLGGGSMWEFQIYVGLKLTMSDNTIWAIYTSKKATTINTDIHIKDINEVKKIKKTIDKIIKKYQ